MKKTIWAIIVSSMLGCMEANAPQTGINNMPKENIGNVDLQKSKTEETNQELSRTLDMNTYIEENPQVSSDANEETTEFSQELSEILDINSYGLDQEEQERQSQIQNLISQIKEPIILWDLTQPNVSITIDDGYWVESIEYMLDLFEKYDVKATFFVIWECLKLHPKLWRRAAQNGHEICNHTATHSKYFKTWDEVERFEKEVLWWEDAVKMVLWEAYFIKMKRNFPFFRFPWMHWIRVKAYEDILKKHGYIPIGWRYTANPKDGVVNNWEIFLWHFKNQDTLNVRKSLDLIKQSNKIAGPVSKSIFTKTYKKPIDWGNYMTMKRQAQAKQYKQYK